MSTTRASLRQVTRLRLGDEPASAWSDPELNQFLHLAIAEYSIWFPLEATATVSVVADQHEYTLSSTTYPGLQSIVGVEYPAGSDPPIYLTMRNHEDPEGFFDVAYAGGWQGGYFDVLGFPRPTSVMLGQSPVAGETFILRYRSDHTQPNSDVEVLTPADGDAPLLVSYTVWLAFSALAARQAATPSLGTPLVTYLQNAASQAWQQYQQQLQQRRSGWNTILG